MQLPGRYLNQFSQNTTQYGSDLHSFHHNCFWIRVHYGQKDVLQHIAVVYIHKQLCNLPRASHPKQHETTHLQAATGVLFCHHSTTSILTTFIGYALNQTTSGKKSLKRPAERSAEPTRKQCISIRSFSSQNDTIAWTAPARFGLIYIGSPTSACPSSLVV